MLIQIIEDPFDQSKVTDSSPDDQDDSTIQNAFDEIKHVWSRNKDSLESSPKLALE